MHTLTVGRTGSGKTTLWRILAGQMMALGCPVLVYDPLNNGIPANRRTTDVYELVRWAREYRSAQIIVDEAGTVLGDPDPEVAYLTTQARNRGHQTHIICQRAVQVNRTVRLQTERLYAFRIDVQEAKTLSAETSNPRVMEAVELDRYQYIMAGSYGEFERFAVAPDGVRRLGLPGKRGPKNDSG